MKKRLTSLVVAVAATLLLAATARAERPVRTKNPLAATLAKLPEPQLKNPFGPTLSRALWPDPVLKNPFANAPASRLPEPKLKNPFARR